MAKHSRSAWTFVALLMTACGSSASAPTDDYIIEANPQPDLGTLAPIAATDSNWTWVSVPQAFCANGSATGFAVNLHANSNQLLIVYEGGGACFDDATCYVLQTASYITSGYDQTTFETQPTEKQALDNNIFLTNRLDPLNPLATANIAYIPYCTGDIHDGNQVVTYKGAKQSTHHVGFRNGQIFTQMLAATLPNVSHVWVSGYSAGGFGATFHYADTQKTFPNARVDLIDDSGSSFPGIGGHPSWAAEVPSTCASCNTNDFTSFIKDFSTQNPQSRIAILSYSADTVLPTFFDISSSQFTTDLGAYEALLDTLPNVKYFVYPGQGHVLLDNESLSVGSESITTWVTQMVDDDAAWASYK